jgi:hypothetical protein
MPRVGMGAVALGVVGLYALTGSVLAVVLALVVVGGVTFGVSLCFGGRAPGLASSANDPATDAGKARPEKQDAAVD